MSENKFKEFWIDIDYSHGIHLWYKKSTFYDYHVIEYSAYEQAQREIKQLHSERLKQEELIYKSVQEIETLKSDKASLLKAIAKQKNDNNKCYEIIGEDIETMNAMDEQLELLRKAVQLQREGLEEINTGKSKDGITYGMYQAHQIARQTLKEVDELLKGER